MSSSRMSKRFDNRLNRFFCSVLLLFIRILILILITEESLVEGSLFSIHRLLEYSVLQANLYGVSEFKFNNRLIYIHVKLFIGVN